MQKTLTVTVKHIDLEGGFWGLLDDKGEQYEPIDLPPGLRQDGLRARVSVSFPDVMTGHMWGVPVEIKSVKEVLK